MFSISERLAKFRDWLFHKVGEEWIFLALLGILMALLSFAMDYVIEKCQEGRRSQNFSSHSFIVTISKNLGLVYTCVLLI